MDELRRDVRKAAVGRTAVAGWVLLLVGVLVAACAPGGREPEEPTPIQLPENLSFVWHDLSGAELNSPAVAVTRAAVESYFLSGQEGDLKGGYLGYQEFVDQDLDFGENTDRYEGTIEFVLVDVSSVDFNGKKDVDATFCYSKYGAASISNGRRYGPNHMLPAGRVRFSLDDAVASQAVESASWEKSEGRQPFLMSNVFERYLHDPRSSKVSIGPAHGYFDQCLAAVNNKTPVESDHPPVEPFVPGWPSSDTA